MSTKEVKNIESTELDTLKSDLGFTELEDRLEMVQAAAADQTRCTNDDCTANGSCK